ncbi:hypothetical protein Bbelb_354780 [Branchiostoma belcheri]|nr:hypothetical protein Bbelb_354780 [Branchiostoma belcheri]
MLFWLLFATACAVPNGPRLCKRTEWFECVPFTGKPTGLASVTGVCVVCEVLNEDGASRSPVLFPAGAEEVAIRGYPFHVLSAEKLAQLDSSEIDTLALIDAKIVDVKNNTFSEFWGLRKMSLDSNRLTDVKQTWFTGLRSLLTLILSNNNIKQIEPGSFKDLTRLRILDLENNLLQAVDQGWLSGLRGSTILNLRSNAINSISPGSFKSLQLTWLDLRDNELSSLDKDVLWGQPWLSRFHASSRSLAGKLNTNTPEQCRQVWEHDSGITVPLMSSTTGQDLEVAQAPDHVLISINVSAAVVLVMSFLAVLLWKVRAARLNAEDDRASDDTHVWTIPPGVAFPGLLRSASLPTYSGKMASDDAASCRSLPAVLHSIEPTYSEIPDDVACAHQGELHGLQDVSVPTHTYSEIPDDEATGPIPFCSDAAFPLHVVTNCRQNRRLLAGNRITSSRQRSGRSIATYGSTGQANDQRNPYYRNASLVQGIRARRQLRTAQVSRPDQGVGTYVNVMDGIMPTYWPLQVPGEGTRYTARRVSLPTVTLPNTYWPWEIPGEGTRNTARRVSLPTVTLPNTYWPWEIPGEETRNTARRVSLPTVTLPNTYWPWEIPEEGTLNTARRASLPTVTLPNTYWPWEIPGERTRNTPRRVSLPDVTLPNTYWPWEIPGEGTCNTTRRASLPTVTLPNTYWPWEIPEEGTLNTPRRASLPTVTLPNTYWPWEIPGEGTRNTARRASLPTITLPNTYWPWEIPGEGTRYTARRVSLPDVTLPNTYWPWEIPREGTCTTARRASLPTVTLPNTYWQWEIPGGGIVNTP